MSEVAEVLKPGSFKKTFTPRSRFIRDGDVTAYYVVPAVVLSPEDFFTKYGTPDEKDIIVKTIKIADKRSDDPHAKRPFEHRNAYMYEQLVPEQGVSQLWERICTEEGFASTFGIGLLERPVVIADAVETITKALKIK